MTSVSEAVAIALEGIPVPSSFKCPITLSIMQDPVVTCDGHVYERAAIQDWIRRSTPGQIISPVTGSVLPSISLTPETPLKRAIEEYLSLRPELQRVELDKLSLQKAAATLEEELFAKSRQRANPQEHEPPCRDSLLEAARTGDVVRSIEIIHRGFPWVNEKDANGCTALHHSARNGLGPVVIALLTEAAFVETSAVAAIDGSRWTALELAVAKGHMTLAKAMNAIIDSGDHSAREASELQQTRKQCRRDSKGGSNEGDMVDFASSSSGISNPSSAGAPIRIEQNCLTVSTFTASDTLGGVYARDGNYHGRPVYQKEGSGVSVFIHFWDCRGGRNGWWFASEVGGTQVYAYNKSSAAEPPPNDWHVPWDGAVDTSVRIRTGRPSSSVDVFTRDSRRPIGLAIGLADRFRSRSRLSNR